MKQALASALGGLPGLGSTDDGRERPVDRIGALASAQAKAGERLSQETVFRALGALLIGLKARRNDFVRDAEDTLCGCLGWDRWTLKLKGKERLRIARWALVEYSMPFCPTCRGATESPNHEDVEGRQPMRQCPSCSGTGLRRFSDSERREAMGDPFKHAMSVAHLILSTSESSAMRGYAQWLGRE